MEGKVEHVKCPKMDSPDLIPEGFGRVQGTPGNPWGALGTPETPRNIRISGFPGFRENSRNFPYISLFPPWQCQLPIHCRSSYMSQASSLEPHCATLLVHLALIARGQVAGRVPLRSYSGEGRHYVKKQSSNQSAI